ncbi:tubby-related protein 3-like protein [Euroglyphus maynei]|uniref:Tubby-related protein 3-like protein n=1 Tax=Euroglyphus maynei TaxID=6958 RepID=A0A1Y3B9Q2_EURMA|nr:tubby-related protein 3-like protein [Euroglyphus maynei]
MTRTKVIINRLSVDDEFHFINDNLRAKKIFFLNFFKISKFQISFCSSSTPIDIVFNNHDDNRSSSTSIQTLLDNKQMNNKQQRIQQEGTTATVWMSDSMESINSSTNDDSIITTNTTDDEQQQNTMNNLTPATSTSTKKVFVLSGRRRKKSKTYLIGNNAFDISRDHCIAKLKSNVLGTQFTAIRLHSNGVRYENVSITYVSVLVF